MVGIRRAYIYHLSKGTALGDVNTWELPVLFGIKYATSFGLFAELDIGPVYYGASIGDSSDSEMKFGLLAGAGFQFMDFNSAVNLFIPSLGDAGDVLGLLFCVGWDFLSL